MCGLGRAQCGRLALCLAPPRSDPTPYTAGCRPTTPDTRHPTPDTRHPTPYTRHPTPDTRHPTPYTRNPTPPPSPSVIRHSPTSTTCKMGVADIGMARAHWRGGLEVRVG
eukprot:3808531-Rhodomonas_salina.2